MDRGLRLRTAHRRSARPHHPSRPHTGDERRQLPAQAEPPQKKSTLRPLRPSTPNAASRKKGLFRYAPEPLLSRKQHQPILISGSLCSAPVVSFYSALDILVVSLSDEHKTPRVCATSRWPYP